MTDTEVRIGIGFDGHWKGLVVDEFYNGEKLEAIYDNGERNGL